MNYTSMAEIDVVMRKPHVLIKCQEPEELVSDKRPPHKLFIMHPI